MLRVEGVVGYFSGFLGLWFRLRGREDSWDVVAVEGFGVWASGFGFWVERLAIMVSGLVLGFTIDGSGMISNK